MWKILAIISTGFLVFIIVGFILLFIGGDSTSSTGTNSESEFLIKVIGTDGLKFSGHYLVYDHTGQSASKSVDGTVPAMYVVKGNIVSVFFQKQTTYGSLAIQIWKDGQVVNSSNTTAEYGVVSLGTQ